MPVSGFKTGLQPPLVSVDQSISDFLARPMDVASVTVSGSQSTTPLLEYKVEQFLATSAVSAKVAGFCAYNFTVKARLVVNADPFLQGRLLMIFVPGGSAQCPLWSTRSQSFVTLSQFPRVELDLASTTTCTLEVPFIYPIPYMFNVNNTVNFNLPAYGSFMIFTYGSVATGTGSSSAMGTLYLSLHDVELTLPGPQAAGAKTSLNSVKSTRRIVGNNSELGRDDIKPLSGTLEGLSFAAGAASRVPVLSSVVEPAAWALDAMAGTAKAYGFSNPDVEAFPHPMTKVALTNMANGDVPGYHQSLSVTRHNRIVGTSLLKGNDDDELSFAAFYSRPAYFGTYTWSAATTAGTRLMAQAMNPSAFYETRVFSSKTVEYRSPLSFLARQFGYWRGGICFRLKFVKTKFHSGRLMISFVPGTSAWAPSAGPDANETLAFRKVVDIKDLSEVDVTVPYLWITPYAMNNKNIGTLHVSVVNTLVAPSTAASSIDFIVEVWGADDFEVACPGIRNATKTAVATLAQPQMDCCDDLPAGDPDPDPTFGNLSTRMAIVPAEMCMGERLLSWRTLLHRANPLDGVWGYGLTGGFAGDPAAIFISRPYTSGTTDGVMGYFTDLYSLVGACFYMNRGSILFKAFTRSAVAGSNTYEATLVCGADSVRTVFSSATQSISVGTGAPVVVEAVNNSNSFTLSVPFYSQTPWCITTHYDGTSTPLAGATDFCRTARKVSFNLPSNGVGGTTLYRSIADDFDFGLFLSTPPIIVNL